MTDVTIPADLADRLRQAADMLEIPCQKDEIGGACPCQVYHYSAALLRAVAEQHQAGRCTCGPITAVGITLDIGVDVRCDAAEALADVILGGAERAAS